MLRSTDCISSELMAFITFVKCPRYFQINDEEFRRATQSDLYLK